MLLLAAATALPAAAGSDGQRRPLVPVAVAATGAAWADDTAPQHEGDGDSLRHLTARWWRWLNSIPFGADPNTDTTGANCRINQSGPVWFLSGPLGSAFTRTCTVPEGKAVLAAIVTYINDYPCPDPAFRPAPGQSLNAFLRDGITPYLDAITLAEARLNGRPLEVKRVTTHVFGFTAAASLLPYDPCLTGSPQLGVSDGYWVLTRPLPRGDHVLEVRSSGPSTGASQGTFVLKVR